MKKYLFLIKLSVLFVFIFTAVFIGFQERELSVKYKIAVAYAESNDYENAKSHIELIGEYKDSEDLLKEYENELSYQKAKKDISDGNYEEAINILTALNGSGSEYKDSLEIQNEAVYKNAVVLGENGKLDDALRLFKNLPLSYMDVRQRIEQLNYAISFTDTWYCKEHQIDLVITAVVTEDNIPHVDLLMKDRNGFLLGDEDNVLKASNIEVFDDRFNWNMFGDGTIFAVILAENELQIIRKPVTSTSVPVSFARKLKTFNSVDGDIDSAVKQDVTKVY